MSRGGRPALDLLGQELRRGTEDYGSLEGSEYVAVFSHKDAPGRPREGRTPLTTLGFGDSGGAPDFLVAEPWIGGTVEHAAQLETPNVVIPGVNPGARITVTFSTGLQGCFMHGYISATAGLIRCWVANLTGHAVTHSPGTFYVSVWNIGTDAIPAPVINVLAMEGGGGFGLEDDSGVILLE